jgi:HD-GYP domain-containing protein (c-di-GMP phosphodiesterase class II)
VTTLSTGSPSRPRMGRVNLPGLDSAKHMPFLERLLADSRARRAARLRRRERMVELPLDLAFLAAAVALVVGFGAPGFHLGEALALAVLCGVASLVRFEVGAGAVDCPQLALVPMLFLLPPAVVPIFVALGLFLATIVDVIRGEAPLDRVLRVGQNLYAVGPALVFAIAGVNGGAWSDAPLLVPAFAAQVVLNLIPTTLHEWIAVGVPPRLHLAVLARVFLVDALLTPVGLLIALGADGDAWKALLALPLLALLGILAEERKQHVSAALELSNAYRGTALLLGDVLEDKDSYTASHSHGVVDLSLRVGAALGLDAAAQRRVEFGALLHDIGKISVPVDIINKPGPLDGPEWGLMKLHTVEGQKLLDRVGGILAEVGVIVRASHEHWDGSGYPDGLVGEEIPIEARIIAACDALSAMTTDRSYRTAMSLEAALSELEAHAGAQFDPIVVERLVGLLRPKIGRVRASLGRRPSRAAAEPARP